MNPLRLPPGLAISFIGMAFCFASVQSVYADTGGWQDCDSSCYVTSYNPVNDTVACLEDLDAYACAALTIIDTCTMAQTIAAQVLGNGADSVTTCSAITSQGIGPDGALRMYGISNSGLVDSDYFIETEVGLSFTQYKNDVAILTGEIAAEDNPDQRFEVFIVYENRVDGSDWDGGFKHDIACIPPTDTWDIYTMKPDQSHLLGKGDLEGSLIRVTHAPSSQYFGFQVGEGANDHNCEYGAGGWFSWEGAICGTELAGAMGDVIVDLDCQTEFDPCNARSTAHFSAYIEDCGVLQYSYDIVRHDDTAPIIAGVPADTIQDCELPLLEPTGVTVSDDCPEPGFPTLTFEGTFEIDPQDGHCKTYEQRWRAEDACGNVSESSRFIHTYDNVPPSMVGQEILELECDQWPGGNEPPFDVLVEAGIIDVQDNCLMDTVLIEYGVMSGGCHYDHVLTYTPVDACGNVGESLYQIVVIHDTSPPVLVDMPADTTVSCATDPSVVNAVPTATDNCDPDVDLSVTSAILDDGDGCPETFVIERVFTAVDCGYNHTTDTQYVHVVDTVAPLLSLDLPENVVLEGCFGEEDLSIEQLGDAVASATDDCGEVTLTLTHTDQLIEVCSNGAGAQGGSASLERTWTLVGVDCTGNSTSTSGTQTIEVQDNTAPSISGDPVVTLACADWLDGFSGEEALAAGFIVASDNCLLDSVSVAIVGQLSGSCAGTFEVVYTAVDACGLTTDASQIVELFDDVPPAFTLLPEDGTLSCDGDPLPYAEGEAEAEDACGLVTITASDVLVIDGCGATAVWERTLTATDDCDNITTHIQRFQREDNEGPTITSFPDDVEASCVLPAFDPSAVTATDDCDVAPVIHHFDDTVSYSCSGTFVVERHIVATDCAGNASEAIQTLSVVDDIAPDMISAGVMVTFSCSEWVCDIDLLQEQGFISATDNCGEVDLSVTCFAMSGGCIEPFGTYTLQYTATDPCGNTSTAEQILLLVDEEAPVGVLECPADVTLNLDSECNYELGAPSSEEPWGQATGSATDNCDASPEMTLSFNDGEPQSSCGVGGNITIERTHTLEVEDRCGNISTETCIQTIVFLDTHGPELEVSPVFPQNIFDCVANTDTSTAALGSPTVMATDACGGEVAVDISYSDSFTTSCAGDDSQPQGSATLERTFTVTATDCVGNETTSETTQIINFFDIEAPELTLTCPADATVLADSDCNADLATDVLGLPGVLAIDNCDTEVSYTFEFTDVETPGDCVGNRAIARTFTVEAIDDCGQAESATCTQNITVLDEVAPTVFLTCPEDAQIELDDNCAWSGDSGAPDVIVADGCDPSPVIEISHADHDTLALCTGEDSSPEGSFSFIRTWTVQATDDCGNSHMTSCDQLVTLLDVLAPINHGLQTLTTDTLVLDNDCSVDIAPALFPASSAEDACDGEVALTVDYTDDPAVYEAQSDGVALEIDTLTMSGVDGMTTYRLYASLTDPSDLLSAVVGEGNDATWITSTAPFYQHPAGGATPQGINPLLFEAFPELEFDSWLTVGIEQAPDPGNGEGDVQLLQTSTWVQEFESGNSVALNSGYGDGWFSTSNTTNGVPDASGRVLIAQLTTAGHLSGQLYFQILEGGVGGTDVRYTLSFGNACTEEDGVQEGSYTFLRTWQGVATDDCGNADTLYTFQNVAVLDTAAPQWTETCGLENGEEITLPCAGEEILDFDPMPDPCLVDAVDQCDTEVGIARFDDIDPDAPTGEVCNVCAPSDPAPTNGGLTCDGEAPQSMRLFNFNGAAEASFTLTSTELSRVQVGCDSSLLVTLNLSDGAGGGFVYQATYEGGWDWDSWSGDGHPGESGTGGSYKQDCPSIFDGNPVWLDWHYFILTGGSLEGTGTYEGSSFNLSHQPSSMYFGFQVGAGANNKNEEYGASGWFFWDGQLVLDGVAQGNWASSGDIFLDLDCCLPWEAEHDYVAQDDCGNAVAFEYTVTNTGIPSETGSGLQGSGHTSGPVVLAGGAPAKSPIQIVGLMPNPTSDLAQLQFEVSEPQRLTVRLHTMSGGHLMDLFDAVAEPNIIYQLPIDVAGMASGLYQLRIAGSEYSEVRKLLVAE